MLDLEHQLAAYAGELVDHAPPVTAEETRARRPSRWRLYLLSVAAAVLVVAGLSAALVLDRGDRTVSTADHRTTLDDHRDWFLAALGGAANTGDAALGARFSASFLDAVPPGELRRVIAEVGEEGPWRVHSEVERRDEALAVQLVDDDGAQARLTLALDDDGRLDAATILLATSCGPLLDAAAIDGLAEPLRGRLDWARGALDSTEPLSEGALDENLAPSFLDAVPPEQFREEAARIRSLGPLTVRAVEGEPTPVRVELVVGLATGEEGRLTLEVEDASPHRITTLLVRTQQPCALG